MPKLALEMIPETNRTGYPAPYDAPVQGRWYRRLAPVSGLSDFGASYVRLVPGAWSSQRHWHEGEDELLVMIAGEAVLVDDRGRTRIGPGDVCAFPKGEANGHHLINEGDADCVFLVIGRPIDSPCHYPDVDMYLPGAGTSVIHKEGTAY